MPHSKFKERVFLLNLGAGKCPCGQTFHYESETVWDMKFQLHSKVCSKPVVEGFREHMISKKAMTMKEQQHDELERMRFYNHHQKYLS